MIHYSRTDSRDPMVNMISLSVIHFWISWWSSVDSSNYLQLLCLKFIVIIKIIRNILLLKPPQTYYLRHMRIGDGIFNRMRRLHCWNWSCIYLNSFVLVIHSFFIIIQIYLYGFQSLKTGWHCLGIWVDRECREAMIELFQYLIIRKRKKCRKWIWKEILK